MEPGDPREPFARLNNDHVPLMISFMFSYIQEGKNVCDM